jgi:hypothetical protein
MDGSREAAVVKMVEEMGRDVAALGGRGIPWKSLVMVVNVVIIPRLLHGLTGSCIGEKTGAGMQSGWIGALKRAMRVPSSTPHGALFASEVGLRDLYSVLAEQEVTDVVMALNSPGRVGRACRQRLEVLRVGRNDVDVPSNRGRRVTGREVGRFGDVAWTCRMLQQMGLGLRAGVGDRSGDPGLQGMLAPVWSQPMGRLLNGQGLFRLSHLLTPKGKEVVTALRARARATGAHIMSGLVGRVCQSGTNILLAPVRTAVAVCKLVIPGRLGWGGKAGREPSGPGGGDLWRRQGASSADGAGSRHLGMRLAAGGRVEGGVGENGSARELHLLRDAGIRRCPPRLSQASKTPLLEGQAGTGQGVAESADPEALDETGDEEGLLVGLGQGLGPGRQTRAPCGGAVDTGTGWDGGQGACRPAREHGPQETAHGGPRPRHCALEGWERASL